MDELSFTLSMMLIALGGVLLLVEFFFTSGFLAIAALIVIAIGIAIPFYHGDTSTGFLSLLGVIVGIPLLFMLPTFGRRGLVAPEPSDIDQALASLPMNQELELLRGRVGQAISPLRPSGVVDFDGKRIDTLTEGFPVDVGDWVRCIDVRAGRVIVRQIDPPGPGGNAAISPEAPAPPPRGPIDLENLDFT